METTDAQNAAMAKYKEDMKEDEAKKKQSN
jgi:hypothetical protein